MSKALFSIVVNLCYSSFNVPFVYCIQARVAQKEEKYLELELINEETSKLIDRSKKQVDANKHDTLQVAKLVTDLQTKIKDATNKTKAIVAELCMYQVRHKYIF